MANPQIEHGHTKIANELMEAWAQMSFSAYETRLMVFIFRQTYGWNKKVDRLSYTQMEIGTGLDRRHLARTIKALLVRNVIVCIGEGYKLEYGIQKDYSLWKNPLPRKSAKSLPVEATKSLPVEATKSLPVEATKSLPVEATKSLPVEATKKLKKSLPVEGESLPVEGESLPVEATVSPPPPKLNVSYIIAPPPLKHIQKHLTKAEGPKSHGNNNFQEFLQEKIKEYPELNILKEWEDCKLWWSEGKKPLQRPKSALNNWLKVAKEKALAAEKKGGTYGSSQGHSNQSQPTAAEYEASIGAPLHD